MSSVHWVIGARGLLGSAVTRAVRARTGSPALTQTVDWNGDAVADLHRGLARTVVQAGGGSWYVYWCAGVGVVGSNPESLQLEVKRFEGLLAALAALPQEDQNRGSLFVASSAGAVYGGSARPPFDEETIPVPLGDYGRAKLALETATSRLSESTAVRCLIGRISNLYGPGQSLSKSQGLISHLCMSTVRRAPLSVYVSLDTLRDYIFVDDCASLIVDACAYLRGTEPGSAHTKILASGRSVTIGALLGEFRRVVGHRPEIVMGSSPQSSQQSRDLRVRSTYWSHLDHREVVTLTDGIARTLEDIRRSVCSSN